MGREQFYNLITRGSLAELLLPLNTGIFPREVLLCFCMMWLYIAQFAIKYSEKKDAYVTQSIYDVKKTFILVDQ